MDTAQTLKEALKKRDEKKLELEQTCREIAVFQARMALTPLSEDQEKYITDARAKITRQRNKLEKLTVEACQAEMEAEQTRWSKEDATEAEQLAERRRRGQEIRVLAEELNRDGALSLLYLKRENWSEVLFLRGRETYASFVACCEKIEEYARFTGRQDTEAARAISQPDFCEMVLSIQKETQPDPEDVLTPTPRSDEEVSEWHSSLMAQEA